MKYYRICSSMHNKEKIYHAETETDALEQANKDFGEIAQLKHLDVTLLEEKRGPKAQSRATAKYDRKKGLIAKTYKLPADVVEAFAEACEEHGVTPANYLTQCMKRLIKRMNIEL